MCAVHFELNVELAGVTGGVAHMCLLDRHTGVDDAQKLTVGNPGSCHACDGICATELCMLQLLCKP